MNVQTQSQSQNKRDMNDQSNEPNLGAAAVHAALKSTVNASTMLQVYTHTVNATPDITLPIEVDTLTGSNVSVSIVAHQTTARTNATAFLSDINPKLIATSAGVIGFANDWDSKFVHLMELAAKIDEDGVKAEFKQGIDLLTASVQRQGEAINPVLVALTNFRVKISADHSNFSSDAALVSKAYESADGEIARLTTRIADDQAKRGTYIGLIVGGVLADIAGVVLILIGVLATIATDGLAVGLILGGVALLAGGTTAMVTAAAELADLDNQIAKDTINRDKDQLIVTSVQTSLHAVKGLVDATQQGLEAVSSLQDAWQGLGDSFERIKQNLDVASPNSGPWLQTALTKANEQWNDALTSAVALQRFGSIPVRKTKLRVVS